METKDVARVPSGGGFVFDPMLGAIAAVSVRIKSLPPEDMDEFWQLAKDLFRATPGSEDWDSISVAMQEILDQAPVQVREMNLAVEEPVRPGLQKWIDYVSEKIRTHRKQAGLTQEELADRSGLPQSHISRLEGGKHSPSRSTLEKIANALGVDVKVFDPMA